MWTLLALLVAQHAAASPPPPAVAIQGTEIYSDKQREISVTLAETPLNTVVITSRLPAGWTFGIDVDGDQNEVWGAGPEKPGISRDRTTDRSFGQDSRNGVFCSQYVFSTFAKDPSEIYAKSECGAMESRGRVIMTGFDSNMHATITLEIPTDEFFGAAQSAHIQTCVWGTLRWNCQHRLPDLQDLKRSSSAQPR